MAEVIYWVKLVARALRLKDLVVAVPICSAVWLMLVSFDGSSAAIQRVDATGVKYLSLAGVFGAVLLTWLLVKKAMGRCTAFLRAKRIIASRRAREEEKAQALRAAFEACSPDELAILRVSVELGTDAVEWEAALIHLRIPPRSRDPKAVDRARSLASSIDALAARGFLLRIGAHQDAYRVDTAIFEATVREPSLVGSSAPSKLFAHDAIDATKRQPVSARARRTPLRG